MRAHHVELAGWGRTAPSAARLVDATAAELAAGERWADLTSSPRGVIARGLGRAYGDPAQNGGGTVVRLDPGANPVWIDEAAGTVTTDAGVSLDELLRRIVPHGWFVPVTPGTRFVTVGGAVASDIHGKNHHADRSFGYHVERFGLLLADGSRVDVTPTSDPDLWWATIGGMGLTGIITDVTFRLLPIETSRCLVVTERIPHLDALLERMERSDDRYRYSVAWVDLVATGDQLGRSVLQLGDHASLDELVERSPRLADDPLAFAPRSLLSVPPLPNVMSRSAVRAFNELWYRKAPRHHVGLETITGFFHPLDGVANWNRFYGAGGFLQYQFVVPFESVGVLRTIIGRLSRSGHASAISVLKRFGAHSGGMLSFPKPGWTLTFDVPAGVDGLAPMLAEFDELVVGAGGRHYLAKDAHTTPDVIRAGYPRLDEWLAVRRRVDPTGVFASDQARRLELI